MNGVCGFTKYPMGFCSHRDAFTRNHRVSIKAALGAIIEPCRSDRESRE